MAAKRYKLNNKLAEPFSRNNEFQFKIRFSRKEGESIRHVSYQKCPVITIQFNGVIQTKDEIAQKYIAAFKVPLNTYRNGHNRESGFFFKDVTDETDDYDLDLDPIFDSVEL